MKLNGILPNGDPSVTAVNALASAKSRRSQKYWQDRVLIALEKLKPPFLRILTDYLKRRGVAVSPIEMFKILEIVHDGTVDLSNRYLPLQFPNRAKAIAHVELLQRFGIEGR